MCTVCRACIVPAVHTHCRGGVRRALRTVLPVHPFSELGKKIELPIGKTPQRERKHRQSMG